MRNMQAMLNWAIENGSHGSAPTLDGAVQQGDPEFEIERQHLMAVGFSSSSSFFFLSFPHPPISLLPSAAIRCTHGICWEPVGMQLRVCLREGIAASARSRMKCV